jgi:hypothetical protein
MSLNSNSSNDFQEKDSYTQILYLNKNINKKKDLDLKSEEKNDEVKDDIPFKILGLSYFNVKDKKYVFFGGGKIILKLSESNGEYINLSLYDSCLQLRFQGFISIKYSSLSLDINKDNCVLINKLIGFVYYTDHNGEQKSNKLMTNIRIYFENENDKNDFIDSFIHI